MPSGMVSPQPDTNVAAPVDDPQIELSRLRKVFGDSRNEIVAVDGADLTVDDGELFAILGPSGSGKTTVLRMIAGFEQPTAGAIKLGGVDVTALPARHRDVNTVFQEYALFPHMTVAQNVEYGLKVKGVPKADRRRRTADALDMVRLTDRAPRSPAQLSGGQRQRVALARALVGRPRVLLLDEPTQGMSPAETLAVDALIKSLAGRVSVLMIEHDVDLVMNISDHVIVMHQGQKLFEGPPAEVRNSSAVRAAYLGADHGAD